MKRFVPVILLVCSTAALAWADPAQLARAYLSKTLQNDQTSQEATIALSSCRDKDIAPLLTALARNGNKQQRLLATSGLGRLTGAEASAALSQRLWQDGQMAIRAEALAHLLNLKAISAAELVKALKIPDENIQCMAARALVKDGQGYEAAKTLQELTGSEDPATACLARLGLLGMGHLEQRAELGKTVRDPNCPADLLKLMLAYIEEQAISQAAELAEHVATSHRNAQLRVLAYRAIAKIAPLASQTLAKAIRTSNNTVFRVQVLAALAKQPDAKKYLTPLAGEQGAVGALARLELARPRGGESAERAAIEAMRLGHPIVVEYVLDRAKKDIQQRSEQADFYTPALLEYISSVPAETSQMGRQHIRAALGATLLADLGTPAAFKGLRGILRGRYNAITRAAAAGLLRTTNPDAANLAAPLLDSPYDELAVDAALTLGRFAHPRATEKLVSILQRPLRNSTTLCTLASWYLLKTYGQGRSTAESLAKEIQEHRTRQESAMGQPILPAE